MDVCDKSVEELTGDLDAFEEKMLEEIRDIANRFFDESPRTIMTPEKNQLGLGQSCQGEIGHVEKDPVEEAMIEKIS